MYKLKCDEFVKRHPDMNLGDMCEYIVMLENAISELAQDVKELKELFLKEQP